jgi:hypothetical protein
MILIGLALAGVVALPRKTCRPIRLPLTAVP